MFGAKRKARKIQVAEENEEPTAAPTTTTDEPMNDGEPPTHFLCCAPSIQHDLADVVLQPKQLADLSSSSTAPPISPSPASIKFTRRPAKSSSLRKSISATNDGDAADDDDDQDGPAVIRPSISRAGSTKLKKKTGSSRLSFGVTAEDNTSTAAAPFTTPKKNPAAASLLTQRAAENRAASRLSTQSFGAEQDRPSYSKAYLDELQSSTPNTPQNLDSLRIHDDDDADTMMASLDAAELEGAVFVPSADLSVSQTGSRAHIPSATEIQAKKERRARLAKEGDAYNSDADQQDEDGFISLLPSKKKDDSRLIAEDEDLGEGYDEFVEDERLELGKRGEKAARRRQRREMEALINAAERSASDDDGDDTDSDVERKAAYEAAQTRAAMDGLMQHRLADQDELGAAGGDRRLVIPKMKPVPELGASLARMRALVLEMEEQVTAKRKRIQGVEREKREILEREKEVQEVLNQAGMKYQSAMGVKVEHVVDAETLAAQSPLRSVGQIKPEERGLESFGTPTGKSDLDTEMK